MTGLDWSTKNCCWDVENPCLPEYTGFPGKPRFLVNLGYLVRKPSFCRKICDIQMLPSNNGIITFSVVMVTVFKGALNARWMHAPVQLNIYEWTPCSGYLAKPTNPYGQSGAKLDKRSSLEIIIFISQPINTVYTIWPGTRYWDIHWVRQIYRDYTAYKNCIWNRYLLQVIVP